MRSRRQTLSQGPVPRKPRSYLSRRKHSVAPHSRGSSRLHLSARIGACNAPAPGDSVATDCPDRHSRMQPATRCTESIERRRTPAELALLSFTSRRGGPSLEQISADDVTSRPLPPTPPMRKEVGMNTS